MSKKTITKDAVAKMADAELKALCGSEKKMAEYDDESKALLTAAHKKMMESGDETDDHDHGDGEDTTTDEGGPKDGDGEESTTDKKSVNADQWKPGARELMRMHRGLSYITKHFADTFENRLDRTPITKSILSVIDSIADERASIEGAFAEQYPDYPPLSEIDDSDFAKADDFEREFKSLLSGDQHASFRTEGIKGRLQRVIDSGKVRGEELGHLQLASRSLERIATEAKSFQAPAPEGMISKADHEAALANEVAKRTAVEETLKELNDAINSEVLPAT